MIKRRTEVGVPASRLGTGAGLFSLGGLAAAFGASTCCALPVALGTLGLGSAWLADVALVTGPYATNLIYLGLAFVFAGLVLDAGSAVLRRRAIRACGEGTCDTGACSPLARWLRLSGLASAMGLIVASLVIR